jgi:hypothetical protein
VQKTFTVENLDDAYVDPPWDRASRREGLTERQAIKLFNEYNRRYHREPRSWSGHVRVVGSDGWLYSVELPDFWGERAGLYRAYHLNDL